MQGPIGIVEAEGTTWVSDGTLFVKLSNDELQKQLHEPPAPGKRTPGGWTVKFKSPGDKGVWILTKPEYEVKETLIEAIMSLEVLKGFADAVELVLVASEMEAHENGLSAAPVMPGERLVKEALKHMDGFMVEMKGDIVVVRKEESKL